MIWITVELTHDAKHCIIVGTLGCVFIDNETHESGVTKCTTGEAWSAFSWHNYKISKDYIFINGKDIFVNFWTCQNYFHVLILIHAFINTQPIFMFNVFILTIFCAKYEKVIIFC